MDLKNSSLMLFDGENNKTENEKSELQLRREKNIRELNEIIFAGDQDGFQNAIANLQEFNKLTSNSTKFPRANKRKKFQRDEAVIFHCQIPKERRKSLRLEKKEPLHYKLELQSDLFDDDDDLTTLEKIVFRPKIRLSSQGGPVQNYIAAEDVTPEYLSKIAKSSTSKIYDNNKGTSCHQCRQKTVDSKTVCRSGKCFGVRGQFCGPCLKNRYGEDAAEALIDPNWECPCCRNRCNCSFCRRREGKRPTGILAPIAQRQGFKSVDEFLQNLNGIGDFSKETEGILLGFDKKGNPVFKED